jgi:hypothetical protein
LFGGEDGILNILNIKTYDITETWKIGHPIIAVDGLECRGDIYIVVGTANNRIYCSVNFI